MSAGQAEIVFVFTKIYIAMKFLTNALSVIL